MLIGFDVVAARPKRDEDDDTPYQESMRGGRKLLSNPSTDQKKERRRQQKSASDLTAESAVRDWYHKRKRAVPAKGGFGCEICNSGNSCPTCGYSAPSGTAIARHAAEVLSREDR